MKIVLGDGEEPYSYYYSKVLFGELDLVVGVDGRCWGIFFELMVFRITTSGFGFAACGELVYRLISVVYDRFVACRMFQKT